MNLNMMASTNVMYCKLVEHEKFIDGIGRILPLALKY
jgi:hypothetical protein